MVGQYLEPLSYVDDVLYKLCKNLRRFIDKCQQILF